MLPRRFVDLIESPKERVGMVVEAVREKRRCFKVWKAGGSRTAYNTVKRASNRAVNHAGGEAEKVALQKIDHRSANIFGLPRKCGVTTRMSWERNLLNCH